MDRSAQKGFFLIILIFLIATIGIVTYLALNELPYLLVQSNYKNTKPCFSDTLSQGKTYESNDGYTLKYPALLRMADSKTNINLILKGGLNIPNFPNAEITVSTIADGDRIYFKVLNLNNQTLIPCRLKDITLLTTHYLDSLFGGSSSYYLQAHVKFPSYEQDGRVLDFSCIERYGGQRCNLLIPQILSTLEFSNH